MSVNQPPPAPQNVASTLSIPTNKQQSPTAGAQQGTNSLVIQRGVGGVGGGASNLNIGGL